MKTIKETQRNKKFKTTYTYGYDSLFNVLFHTGVIINILLVTWMTLEFNGLY
jgi:hypothetical protein